MTLRLIYSRPMAVYVAGDEPRRESQSSLLGRLFQLVLEAMQRSRTRAAMREIRRYQHLVCKDVNTDKT